MSRYFEGNAIELLENGVEYFPALLAEIASARQEVFIETYIFMPDRTGRAVAAALLQAAARGVTVRVLVDGFGSRRFVEELMPELQAGGVLVQVYRREIRALSLRRHRLRRLHRKLAVIDGRVAFVGGINIVDDYEPDGPPYPRHDYAVRVEGPLLQSIHYAVRHLWRLVAWASLRSRRLEPVLPMLARPEQAGRIRAAFLIRDNLRHRRDIEQAYLEALARARSEVIIACAYFFPGRRFRQALTDAARRGVRVILLLQGLSDHPVLAHASRALYPHFMSCGIHLFEYQQSYLHAKVAVVDGVWATVGSSNIDPFSLLLAREANVLIDDARFAGQLRASLQRAMQAGAVELREDALRRLPLVRRMASWISLQCVRMAIGLAGYRGEH